MNDEQRRFSSMSDATSNPSTRNPRWRQPTPMMQLTALLFGIEGHKCNHDEGLITDQQYIEVVTQYIDELYALRPFVELGHW